jgi:hypothetical protein
MPQIEPDNNFGQRHRERLQIIAVDHALIERDSDRRRGGKHVGRHLKAADASLDDQEQDRDRNQAFQNAPRRPARLLGRGGLGCMRLGC